MGALTRFEPLMTDLFNEPFPSMFSRFLRSPEWMPQMRAPN